MPTHRMHRGLVALSASAVAAIYMAGYLRTQAADASIGAADIPTAVAAESSPIAAAAPATATPIPQPVIQRQVPTARTAPRVAATPQPQAPSQPQAQSQPQTQARPQAQPTASTATKSATQLHDGTFTGQGTSRRGDVWVSLQVQGGQITSVNITRTTLQYPLRDIANLPSEVVQRQSAQVDTVSRATYSSMAFRGAVTQAITAAQAG